MRLRIRNIIAPAIAAFAAAGALSWWLSRRGGQLERGLEGAGRVWKWRDFEIDFVSAGEGTPLVLMHGIYPGASNAQWEHNFNTLAKNFRVFAPDLLGFGRSSRPAINYGPAVYKDLIADFLKEVVEEPAIVVASGQTAPFVIEVAGAYPKRIARLVLDGPTGLTRFSARAPIRQRLAFYFLRLPIFGSLAYFWLFSKRRIARALRMETVTDPSLITPSVINDIYQQAHQPGAKWVPIAMVGGRLNLNVKAAYEKLIQPILILWGEMPSYIPVSDAKDFLNFNNNAVLQTFPEGRLMPEFEHPTKFNAYIQQWAEGRLAA